jgi:hypothetical protein
MQFVCGLVRLVIVDGVIRPFLPPMSRVGKWFRKNYTLHQQEANLQAGV